MSELERHLEPGAIRSAASLDGMARVSIAISLKRIADFLGRLEDDHNKRTKGRSA